MDNINEHDFSKVKVVIIGVGTNDTTEQSADTIFENLVNGGMHLLKKYPGLKVCIAQIPPRKFSKDTSTDDLNKLIETALPPNIHAVLHNNLNGDDMHDDKHVSRNSLGTFIRNMREKIMDLIGRRRESDYEHSRRNSRDHRDRRNRNPRDHDGDGGNRRQQGNPDNRGDRRSNQEGELNSAKQLVIKALEIMEHSNNSMKEQMKNLLNQ